MSLTDNDFNRLVIINGSFNFYNKYQDLINRDEDEQETICYICYSGRLSEYFIKPCLCYQPVHTFCIDKVGKTNCMTCGDQIKCNEKICDCMHQSAYPMFFPDYKFYPVPLISGSIVKKVSDTYEISFAIMYLQTRKVKELVSQMDDSQFIKSKCYAGLSLFEAFDYCNHNYKLNNSPSNSNLGQNNKSVEMIQHIYVERSKELFGE